MIIRSIFGLILFLSAFLFLACTGSTQVPSSKLDIEDSCEIDGENAPQWVCGSVDIEGAYTDSGSASPNPLGFSFQRREALAQARSNLAQQMQTLVKDKVENFARVTGVGNGAVADKVATQVSKQAAEVSLKGSKQIRLWKHNNGTVYVLVGVAKRPFNKAVKNQVESSYKNDDALWQQFQSKNALEALDKEFQ